MSKLFNNVNQKTSPDQKYLPTASQPFQPENFMLKEKIVCFGIHMTKISEMYISNLCFEYKCQKYFSLISKSKFLGFFQYVFFHKPNLLFFLI